MAIGDPKPDFHNINAHTKFGKKSLIFTEKKVREKSRECHNYKSQPFPDTKTPREREKR